MAKVNFHLVKDGIPQRRVVVLTYGGGHYSLAVCSDEVIDSYGEVENSGIFVLKDLVGGYYPEATHWAYLPEPPEEG